MLNTSTLAAAAAALTLSVASAQAQTSYPLTIENCGQTVTFEQAPQNAVALGQNSAEIMLLLGLEVLLPRKPHWVRLTLARREHEARRLLRAMKHEK